MTEEERIEYEKMMEETYQQQLIDFPLKPGYTRRYTDHTGRWFEDLSPEEIEAEKNDPYNKIVIDAITEEINKEIIRSIVLSAKKET